MSSAHRSGARARPLGALACWLTLVVLGSAVSVTTHAHGGVSMEEDTCIMRIGPYRAHFTGYQPRVRASQEFCEDIPVVGDAIIVLDFLDAILREYAVDVRVVRDVNNIGINGTYEQLGGPAAIEAATLFYADPAAYPRGNLDVSLTFDAPGSFVGIVTARDPSGAQEYIAVFPFSVGVRPWTDAIGWLVAVVVLGIALYLQPWKRRRAAHAGDPGSDPAA